MVQRRRNKKTSKILEKKKRKYKRVGKKQSGGFMLKLAKWFARGANKLKQKAKKSLENDKGW